MPIQLSTQAAILDWNIKKASLDQFGNGIQVLDIQTEKPTILLQTTQAKVIIDQSDAFSDAGLKGIRAFMDDSVSYSRQIVAEGIDRIVSQGNEFINIYSNYDPIPDQAISNSYEMFNHAFNYGVIPQSRPQISVQEGQVNSEFRKGSVVNNSYPNKVEMTYTPWQINYFMKQYNSLQINYETSKFKFSL